MINVETEMLRYIILGLLGAITYIFLWSKNWGDLKKYSNIRHLIVGGIAGYIYRILVVEHGFPDSIMAFIVGYSAPDFIQALVNKFKPLEEKSKL